MIALQEKIDHEYKMRDGAVKLLQASKSAQQSMEASKGLFVSNAKIIALMRELQQMQGDVTKKEARYEIEFVVGGIGKAYRLYACSYWAHM